jgi:purine-binding chemotaxis protein CheW
MKREEREQSDMNILQYLTFYLKNELYGIDISHIREVIDFENVFPVPLVPDYIRGVINLRGDVVPVIDLSRRFDYDKSEITRFSSIVILEVESEDSIINVGIIIDAVNNVMDISEDDIDPVPNFGAKIRHDFIAGIGKKNGLFIVLLNIVTSLDVEELSDFHTGTKQVIQGGDIV